MTKEKYPDNRSRAAHLESSFVFQAETSWDIKKKRKMLHFFGHSIPLPKNFEKFKFEDKDYFYSYYKIDLLLSGPISLSPEVEAPTMEEVYYLKAEKKIVLCDLNGFSSEVWFHPKIRGTEEEKKYRREYGL